MQFSLLFKESIFVLRVISCCKFAFLRTFKIQLSRFFNVYFSSPLLSLSLKPNSHQTKEANESVQPSNSSSADLFVDVGVNTSVLDQICLTFNYENIYHPSELADAEDEESQVTRDISPLL